MAHKILADFRSAINKQIETSESLSKRLSKAVTLLDLVLLGNLSEKEQEEYIFIICDQVDGTIKLATNLLEQLMRLPYSFLHSALKQYREENKADDDVIVEEE